MKSTDALEFYGSWGEVAKQAGVTRQAVHQWKELVPPLSAMKLSVASKGKLTFDPVLYDGYYKQESA